MRAFLSAFIIIISLLFPSALFGQKIESSAFGAPVLKFTSLKGQSALVIGGRGGWMINKKIVLGGGFYALANNVKSGIIDPQNGQNVSMGFNYGGLELEYIFWSEASVHASLDMLLAGGGVTFVASNENTSHLNYYSQDLLVWEPEVNIEFKIVNWLHLAAGISYRIISSYNAYFGISKDSLSGLNGVFTFKFGTY
jgi:hypothetical protein